MQIPDNPWLVLLGRVHAAENEEHPLNSKEAVRGGRRQKIAVLLLSQQARLPVVPLVTPERMVGRKERIVDVEDEQDVFGAVYRFDQATGKITSAKRSRATSAPVVVGGKVFYTQRADDGRSGKAEESMVGLDRNNGKQQYEVNRKVADYLDQKVQGASELMEQGMALDAANGFAGGAPASANAEAALANIGQTNVSTLQAFQGSRVLAFRDRNFNCMGDEVFCTDPATGKTVWKFKLEGNLKKLGGFLAAPPVAAGDQVFLGTLRGEVLQIDPASGKVVKTYQTGSPIRYQPVVNGGRIYVGTQDGRLVCVDTGNKEFTGWSMWGGNAARTGIRETLQ